MKNINRLLNTCMYDLLLRIANNTDACIIRLTSGNMPSVNRCNKFRCCATCLQSWLNEEEEKNGKTDRKNV